MKKTFLLAVGTGLLTLAACTKNPTELDKARLLQGQQAADFVKAKVDSIQADESEKAIRKSSYDDGLAAARLIKQKIPAIVNDAANKFNTEAVKISGQGVTLFSYAGGYRVVTVVNATDNKGGQSRFVGGNKQ